MTEIFDELAVVGDAIEEEDRVVHMLASLPDSFSMLVTALQTSPDVPALELVTERLMYEEQKMKEKRGGAFLRSGEDALFSGVIKSKSKVSGPCFFCDEIGHVKRDCKEFRKYREEKLKESKPKESAHFTTENSREDSDGDSYDDDRFAECIALIANDALQLSTPTKIDNKWIVDSAASSHMCNDVTRFLNLKKLREMKKIKVGDGFVVEAKAEGTVMLHVTTPSGVRQCKLQNVLYVPELKFNLLSVSKASRAGKKVSFEQDRCNFIDNSSKEVLFSGTKIGNLYYVSCADRNNQRVKRNFKKEEMARTLKMFKETSFETDLLKRLHTNEVDSRRFKEDQNEEDSCQYKGAGFNVI